MSGARECAAGRAGILEALALGTALVCLTAGAQAQSVEDSLRRCAAEHDPAKRLGCFDAIAGALPKIEADRFGLTEDIKRKRDPVAVERAKNESLPGQIASLRKAPHGEWIFTLDNGQVWAQAEPRASLEFSAGEPVRIEQGAMGSLWLAAANHRKVRVKRIQ